MILSRRPTPTAASPTSPPRAAPQGKALDGAYSVTVSPDGKSAYVASVFSDAVAVFDRDTTTGKLTQKADPDGCITNVATTGCTTGKALDGATSVTVSPDGKSAYVASFSSDAVAVFDRDTTTGSTDPEGRPRRLHHQRRHRGLHHGQGARRRHLGHRLPGRQERLRRLALQRRRRRLRPRHHHRSPDPEGRPRRLHHQRRHHGLHHGQGARRRPIGHRLPGRQERLRRLGQQRRRRRL